jgi:hypothetical protein
VTAGLPLPRIQTIGFHPARLLGRIRQTLNSATTFKESNSMPLSKDVITSLLKFEI